MSLCWPVFMPACGHFSQQVLNGDRVCEICTRPPVMHCGHVPDQLLEDGTWLCEVCSKSAEDWSRERAGLIDPTATWDELVGRKMLCFICRDERNFFILQEAPPGMKAMVSSWAAYGFRRTPEEEFDYWYCGCDGWE